MKSGKSKDFIACQLNVHRSTVFREVLRHKSSRGCYSARIATERVKEGKDRFSANRKFTTEVEKFVVKHIEQGWSPEQIVGYCNRNHREMVSHERIYQFLRQDKEKGGSLYLKCRHKLKHRKRPVGKHLPIANRVSIDQRPQCVGNRERFGDWEMDTIIGANNKGAILTFTERLTNFLFIRKLPFGKKAEMLSKVLCEALLPYKKHVHTITTDNGPEFADHIRVRTKLNTSVFFANPYRSWEKGTIENANKLIRQYIPKKSNLNQFSQEQLSQIQYIINNRPRKKLNFESPRNLFFKFVNGSVAFGG